MLVHCRCSDAGAGSHAAPGRPRRIAEGPCCRATAVELPHPDSNGPESGTHSRPGCRGARPGCHQSTAHQQIHTAHQDRSGLCILCASTLVVCALRTCWVACFLAQVCAHGSGSGWVWGILPRAVWAQCDTAGHTSWLLLQQWACTPAVKLLDVAWLCGSACA